MQGKTAYDNIYIEAGQTIKASVTASDPDGDSLVYGWEIMPEVPENKQSDGGDFEPRPTTAFHQQTTKNYLEIDVRLARGAYRLFVYAKDGHNSAATANIPFFVRGGSEDESGKK